MANNNNETVHISLGTTANHITSHLLNLQGLAATTKSSSSSNDEDFALCEFVCTSKIEVQTIIRNALELVRKENS